MQYRCDHYTAASCVLRFPFFNKKTVCVSSADSIWECRVGLLSAAGGKPAGIRQWNEICLNTSAKQNRMLRDNTKIKINAGQRGCFSDLLFLLNRTAADRWQILCHANTHLLYCLRWRWKKKVRAELQMKTRRRSQSHKLQVHGNCSW